MRIGYLHCKHNMQCIVDGRGLKRPLYCYKRTWSSVTSALNIHDWSMIGDPWDTGAIIRVMVHGNEILDVLFLQMFKSSYFLFPDHNFSLNSNVQVASLSNLGWSRHFWDTFHGISGLTVFELVCINFIRIRNGIIQYFWAEHETRTWWAFQKETCWV